MYFLPLCIDGGGTGDDLQQLLGNGRLTSSVVLLAESLSQRGGVVTSALHALHPRGKLTRHTLLERAEDLSVEVKGQDRVDDLERILLEDHIVRELLRLGHVELLALNAEVTPGGGELENLVALVGDLAGRERNEGAHTGRGGDERDELRVKELDRVRLPSEEGVDDLLADSQSLLRVGVLSAVVDSPDGVLPSLEVANSLLADEDHVRLNSLGLELLEPGLGLLDHEGVVAAAKSTVAGDDNERDLVDLPLGEEGEVHGLTSEALDEPTEDRLEGLGERPGGQDSVLTFAAATSFMADVIFFVLFTEEMRSRMALALPSMTIVDRRVRWVAGAKTSAGAAGARTVWWDGTVVKAEVVATRAAATQRNFMVI